MTVVYVVVFYILLGSAFYLFTYMWRDYRKDVLRHQLFAIRDDLFMLAATNQYIDFDNNAYCTLRTTLNGMIRYADELTLGQIYIDQKILGKNMSIHESYIEELDAALDQLNSNERIQIENFISQMHFAIANHVFATNPILFSILVPAKIIGVVIEKLELNLARKLMQRTEKSIKALDSLANAVGTYDAVVSSFNLQHSHSNARLA